MLTGVYVRLHADAVLLLIVILRITIINTVLPMICWVDAIFYMPLETVQLKM